MDLAQQSHTKNANDRCRHFRRYKWFELHLSPSNAKRKRLTHILLSRV